MQITERRLLAVAFAAAILSVVAQAAYCQQAHLPGRSMAVAPAVQPVSMTSNSLAGFEARLNALEASMAEDKKARSEWKDVSNEKWTSKVGGRIMGDYVMFASQDAASQAAYDDLQNYFEMRRMRLFVSGKGYGVYDYKLQLDYEPEPGWVSMKDAYVGIHEVPFFGYVRFGNYKEPFSLEELTSSKYITFLERSLPTVLWAPSRHVGVTAYRHTESEDATLAYGVFFNDISQTEKERIGDAQGIDFATRATWLPYCGCDGRSLLHLGAGYVYRDDRDDSYNFRSRPEVHEGDRLVATGNLDLRHFQTMNLETASVHGPFSVQSELFYTQTDGINGVADMDFYGGYVFLSYFLTGEHRPYKKSKGVFDRVKPFTNFWIVPTSDGPSAGWGAWELTTRYSFVDLQDPTLTNDIRGQLHDLTVGMNWYWNPHTRMMFNWIHAYGDMDVHGQTNTDILSMRMQVDF
jgi:phosphate-selective porin OprO and OprP